MDTKKWETKIDQLTVIFHQEFGLLTPAQLNWKPNPQVWSIAQNLDHLIVINSTYYPIIEEIRSGNYTVPFIGKIGFMVNMIGKMILNGVQPDRKRKMKTFTIWEPTNGNIDATILGKFEAHQQELKELIRNSQDLLDQGMVISSPVNKNIVYKLETAFDIIVMHEERHLEQAKELKMLMEKPI